MDADVDFSALEEHFAAAAVKEGEVVGGVKKKPSLVTLLTMQRANNSGVMLANLKKPTSFIVDSIRDLVTTGSCIGLTDDQVDSISKVAMPSPDERKTLAAYSGDENLLGPPEQLLKGEGSQSFIQGPLIGIEID